MNISKSEERYLGDWLDQVDKASEFWASVRSKKEAQPAKDVVKDDEALK